MNWKQPKVYAVKYKDESTRAASRSGVFLQPCLVKYCPTAV
jgi:hypothetical protein